MPPPAHGDKNAWEKLAQDCALGAMYDSNEREPQSGCLPGTRTALLRDLKDLAEDKKRKIIWLSGDSGCGKSTVARTLAEELRDKGMLAGTFFFSRKNTKRSTLDHVLLTLAYQLGSQHPQVKEMIMKAISDDPTLLSSERSRRDQLEMLVIQPLKKLARGLWAGKAGMSIILDALDEGTTNGLHHIRPFIALLARIVRDADLPISNIIVTSRSWPQIRAVMRRADFSDVMKAVLVEDYDAREDVDRFLRHAFDEMYEAHELAEFRSTPWPSDADFSMLSRRANGRFIFAATIIRLIDQPEVLPHIRLPLVCGMLRGSVSRTSGNIDHLYSSIIDNIDSSVRQKGLEYLALIVNLAEPLPLRDLNRLFSDHIDVYLPPFSALISVPPLDSSDPVQIFHTSLRDFLQSRGENNRGDSYPLPLQIHTYLSSTCFRVMSELLKRDICSLQDPSLLHEEILDFPQRRDALPRALRYACRHWPYHLQNCQPDSEIPTLLLEFLRQRVLFAIEAYAIFGELALGLENFRSAREIVKTWTEHSFSDRDDAMNLLYDSWRLTLDFFDPISVSALHVYESALPCAPAKSAIRLAYVEALAGVASFVIEKGLDEHWGCVTRVIEVGDSLDRQVGFHDVHAVLSPDGSEFAAMCKDGAIRVWSTASGLVIKSLPATARFGGPQGYLEVEGGIIHGGPYVAFCHRTGGAGVETSRKYVCWWLADDAPVSIDAPRSEKAIRMAPSRTGGKFACVVKCDWGRGDLYLRVHDAATCQQLCQCRISSFREFGFPPGPHIEFSSDDSWLIVYMDQYATTFVIDSANGSLLQKIRCNCHNARPALPSIHQSQEQLQTQYHLINPFDNSISHIVLAMSSNQDMVATLEVTPTLKTTEPVDVQHEILIYDKNTSLYNDIVGFRLGDKMRGIYDKSHTRWEAQTEDHFGATSIVESRSSQLLILDLGQTTSVPLPRHLQGTITRKWSPVAPDEGLYLDWSFDEERLSGWQSSPSERRYFVVGDHWQTEISCPDSNTFFSPKKTYMAFYTIDENGTCSLECWHLKSRGRIRSALPIRDLELKPKDGAWARPEAARRADSYNGVPWQPGLDNVKFSADETIAVALWKYTSSASRWNIAVYTLVDGKLMQTSFASFPCLGRYILCVLASVTTEALDFACIAHSPYPALHRIRSKIRGESLIFVTKLARSQTLPGLVNWSAQPVVHSPAFERVYYCTHSPERMIGLNLVPTQRSSNFEDEASGQGSYELDDEEDRMAGFDTKSWSNLCLSHDGWFRKGKRKICWLPVRYRPFDPRDKDDKFTFKLDIDGQRVTARSTKREGEQSFTIRLLNTEIEYYK